MREDCMGDSRVERSMIKAIRDSRDNTRRRRRGVILHLHLVGEVISHKEGIRHNSSTHPSIKGSRGKSRSGR
jgi:hypothetical protein